MNQQLPDNNNKITPEIDTITHVWLIVTNVIFGATSLVITIPLLLASIMMLTADTTGVGLLIFSVISFPLLSILSIIFSWKLYRVNNYVGARYVSLLPLISALLYRMAWFIMDVP